MPLPFDIKSIDKKKMIILVTAVVLGFIAVLLTNNYIDTKEKAIVSSMGGMTRQQVAQLEERLKNVEGQNQALASALQQQNASIQQEVQKMAASLSAAAVSQAEQVKAPIDVKTPPGKRAVTVVVDKTSAVGGLVAPGDYVDIIAHLNSPPESIKSLKTEGSLVVTVFQNIQILAIGDNTVFGKRADDQLAAGSLSITFALNPHEASLLSFVQQNGSLQLVLRPHSDGESYIMPAASWKTLAEYIAATQGKEISDTKAGSEESDKDAEAAKEAAEKAKTIEVFKGGQ